MIIHGRSRSTSDIFCWSNWQIIIQKFLSFNLRSNVIETIKSQKAQIFEESINKMFQLNTDRLGRLTFTMHYMQNLFDAIECKSTINIIELIQNERP